MTTPPEPQSPPQPPLSRRAVLAGAAAAGGVAALGVTLAACGNDPEPAPGASGEGGTTVKAADVPVGGGTIVADAQVVVTQPTAGEFKAFSATCTHQGCTVASVQNGVIVCYCHNSQFSAADGSVVSGPASKALTAKQVSVSGDSVTVA